MMPAAGCLMPAANLSSVNYLTTGPPSGLCPACHALTLCDGSCFRLDEEARSLGYYQDAHRAWPVNLDVISWLGAFHVRNEVYERAIPYFELAAAIQPQEVKWALMTASCYRRIGSYGPALKR
eukprot:GHRQ01024211.1.p2 GENE.GHRQ01024211.1~~GHRQ01024211.1.p2  ORF type:complete len:123 (-),score=25.01 GHRQ01024211.1:28-396(-)